MRARDGFCTPGDGMAALYLGMRADAPRRAGWTRPTRFGMIAPIRPKGSPVITALTPPAPSLRSFPADPMLAELLDLSDDTIFVRGAHGAITYWNGGAARVYGWDAAEMAEKDAYARLGTRFSQPREAVETELERTGRWSGMIYRTTRDGRELVLSARWAARRDSSGEIAAIIETARDLTVGTIATEELRRSEYRYRNMFQAMAVSFWELDFSDAKALLRGWLGVAEPAAADAARHFAAYPDAVRQMMAVTRIVDVNDITLPLFGAASREALGHTIERFWPRSSDPVFAAMVTTALSGAANFEAETRLARVDGQEIDVLFTCGFPPERGNVLVGITDISGRVRAQEEVRRVRDELAHAARIATLGELAASIAHEVNQPLAAIVNFGEAAKRWLNRPEPDMDEAQVAIAQMIADSRRASEIIGRIRAMATKSVPRPTLFHPCEAVKEAVQLVRHDMQAQGVALSIDEVEAVPKVHADRIQIQQVAVNLIVNAVQAMAQMPEDRRALAISTRRLADGMVRIEVRDSGPGIDAAVADRLFTAFSSTKPAGMGMGLSISRSIVEAHGGTISGESNRDGPGSTFAFTLPIAAGEADAAMPCPNGVG